MKNDRWLPILITLFLVGLGIFVGVSTVLGARSKKEKVPSADILSTTSEVATGSSVSEPIKRAEVAVLRGIDRENKKIGVYLLSASEETSFSYDLATSVRSVKDKELVMEELPLGSIINIEKKSGDLLSKVEVNKNSWNYKGVKNFRINEINSTMKIGEREFTYDAGITIISEKMMGNIENIDTSKDVLEIRGLGEKILSIDVTRGHGFIEFKNYDNFIGGSIEIGYDVFDEVAEKMHYVLREGRYKVIMRNGDFFANRVVDIERNKKTVLNFSGYRSIAKNSEVSFDILPEDAEDVTVSIDDKAVETSYPIKLKYGEYIVRVTADSHEKWEKVVKVSKPKTVIKVKLKEQERDENEDIDEDEHNDKDNNSSNRPYKNNRNVHSKNNVVDEDEISENNKNSEKKIEKRTDSTSVISFRKPIGATIRFDGKVIGDAPCEITKVTGEHEITVSKDGYETSNYTVNIADDGEDAIFSFPEMTKAGS